MSLFFLQFLALLCFFYSKHSEPFFAFVNYVEVATSYSDIVDFTCLWIKAISLNKGTGFIAKTHLFHIPCWSSFIDGFVADQIEC